MPHCALHRVGHRHSTRYRQAFQAGGDVHPITVHRTVGLLEHVAQVHTDPKTHASIGRHAGDKGFEPLLNVERRADRTGCGFEHRQHRVSRHVDDPTVVCFDLLTEHRACRVERGHGSLFVAGHQARIAGGVGGQDGYKAMTRFRAVLLTQSRLLREHLCCVAS